MGRRWLIAFLTLLARAVIRKYRPRIVAVTGSVGKTTTRQMIAAVLAQRWRIGTAQKNYNNELGVPFTILGVAAPGRSPGRWLLVFTVGFWLLLRRDKNYPEWLVLEFGADHPDDITHLMSIAPPDIGVLTAVAAAHTEFFGSLDGVLAEKKKIVTTLAADKIAVLNLDNDRVRSIMPEISAHLWYYSLEQAANVTISGAQIHYNDEGAPDGMAGAWQNSVEANELFVPGVVGRPVLYAAAAAVAVANAVEMTDKEIKAGLAAYTPPSGRLRLLPGIKNTWLIDDTYNASPAAAQVAMETLAEIQGGERRLAVLGDMLELGQATRLAHEELGRLVAELKIDILLTVGSAGQFVAAAARAAGMSEEQVFVFADSQSAGRFLQDLMRPGDIVLIKGSQGIRMEKIVKEVMAYPERAADLLVRQGKGWVE